MINLPHFLKVRMKLAGQKACLAWCYSNGHTLWEGVTSKDPAQLNAALVIHLPLPIYNVRGASLH